MKAEARCGGEMEAMYKKQERSSTCGSYSNDNGVGLAHNFWRSMFLRCGKRKVVLVVDSARDVEDGSFVSINDRGGGKGPATMFRVSVEYIQPYFAYRFLQIEKGNNF